MESCKILDLSEQCFTSHSDTLVNFPLNDHTRHIAQKISQIIGTDFGLKFGEWSDEVSIWLTDFYDVEGVHCGMLSFEGCSITDEQLGEVVEIISRAAPRFFSLQKNQIRLQNEETVLKVQELANKGCLVDLRNNPLDEEIKEKFVRHPKIIYTSRF